MEREKDRVIEENKFLLFRLSSEKGSDVNDDDSDTTLSQSSSDSDSSDDELTSDDQHDTQNEYIFDAH